MAPTSARTVSRSGRRYGPSVQGWILPHLIALVERMGHDASAIRRIRGLEILDDPDLRVPEAAAQDAWRLAVEITGEEGLGLQLAQTLPRGALDLVEYAFRSSASLRVGLERLARYGRVVSDRVAARMEENGEGMFLLIGDAGDGPLHPARADLSVAIALRLAREGTGMDVTPLHVSFAHAAPADAAEYQRFFHVPVSFSGGANTMMLSPADAALPLRGADAALSAIVRRRLEKTLGERDAPESGTLSSRVRRLLVEDLGQTAVVPTVVARALGLSQRTLSRRLAAEGTSFRQILDDTRCEFAMALLQDRGLSIGDIAFFLQYSEPAAFHRSFKRWTRQTPRQYRDGLAPSA